MDFRHIPILLAALYGGGFASIIAGITISIFRISYFGVSTPAIIASINMLIVAIACALISKLNLNEFKKFIYMNFISYLIITSTFLLIIKDPIALPHTLVCFWLGSSIIGILAYYIGNYMNTSIKLLNRLMEPKHDLLKKANIEDIDLIIVPGVVFDKHCNRIGFGAGYYDRFLSKRAKNTPTIGIAYDYQIIDKISIGEYDVPLDFIITEKRIIYPK